MLIVLTAFYVMIAVGSAQESRQPFAEGGAAEAMIVYPGWAWWLGMVASIGWLALALLLRKDKRRMTESQASTGPCADVEAAPTEPLGPEIEPPAIEGTKEES
eukprot:jgi/Botrbrau1/16461/Bobra.0142s0056.1